MYVLFRLYIIVLLTFETAFLKTNDVGNELKEKCKAVLSDDGDRYTVCIHLWRVIFFAAINM